MRSRFALTMVFSMMMPISTELAAQMRPDVTGTTAAVTADHPLAAAAGADVLRRGGNAMDAAITMAAVLAVVRPHMNGVGGDAFLLYREAKSGKIYALNGSGRSGRLARPEVFRERGLTSVPDTGALSITIPGAVRAWSDALRRFGTFGLAAALEPAIRYADDGFPISPKLAADIESDRRQLLRDENMRDVYLSREHAPQAGTLLKQKDLAKTLRTIAEEGADVLYAGALAQRLAEFAVREGALFTLEDLAAHSSTWQEPISTDYHDLKVVGFPPNSQGIALLMQLNVAELMDVRSFKHNTADYIHTLVEIKKRVFADRDRYVTDPATAEVPIERLLSSDHARDIARAVQSAAVDQAPQPPTRNGSGDTVFLTVVDRQGNAVALIQSLYASFGSGRMVPGTGIVLHNRGALFSLDPRHVNVIAPGKRTYHTLAPGMVLRKDNSLMMAFGTPGSDGQTQTMLQVLNNIYLFGMAPQQAVDAPRYRSYDSSLLLDAGIPVDVREALEKRGHRVRVQETPSAELGGAQVIMVLPSGVKWIGADHRREAYGIAW